MNDGRKNVSRILRHAPLRNDRSHAIQGWRLLRELTPGCVLNPSGSQSILLEDELAGEPGFEDLGLHEVVDGAGQGIAIQEDEVGEFAGLQAASVFFGFEEDGVVAGVEADGFFACEGVLDVDGGVELAGFAGDGGPHAEPGVVGIDAAEGADFLHVIAAAADDDFLIEAGTEGLEA